MYFHLIYMTVNLSSHLFKLCIFVHVFSLYQIGLQIN